MRRWDHEWGGAGWEVWCGVGVCGVFGGLWAAEWGRAGGYIGFSLSGGDLGAREWERELERGGWGVRGLGGWEFRDGW